MIQKLTQEQIDLLPVWRDRWIEIGLSCDPLDYDNAVDAATRAYHQAGLKTPRFVVCDSPFGGVVTATILKLGDSVRDSVWDSVWNLVWDSVGDSVWDSVGDSVWNLVWDSVGDSVWKLVRDSVWNSARDSVRDLVWNSAYGSHDAYWLGFLDYFGQVIGINISLLQPLVDLARYCGWWIPYENVCILQHRHSELHLDNNGQLHDESGMAVKYRDGWGVYAWHGRRIDEIDSWIITNPERITFDSICNEKNAELRRVMLAQVGSSNFLDMSNAILVDGDPWNMVDLFCANTPYGDVYMTKSTCHSTGREYVNFLPRAFDTAQEALQWRYGVDIYAPNNQS